MARRSIYIHKIQKKYALLTINLLLGYTLILALVAFIPPAIILWDSNTMLPLRQMAAEEFIVLADRLWPAVLISFPVFVLLSFFFTHRFAGPVYRLKQMMDLIGQGDLSTRLQFRTKDDFQELAEALNQMVEYHHESVTRLNGAQARLDDIVKRARGEGKSPRIVQDAEAVSREMRSILDQFKLRDD